MGFPIGNHTYDHKNLKELTEEEQREQIIPLSDKIEEIIGERPLFSELHMVQIQITRRSLSKKRACC